MRTWMKSPESQQNLRRVGKCVTFVGRVVEVSTIDYIIKYNLLGKLSDLAILFLLQVVLTTVVSI